MMSNPSLVVYACVCKETTILAEFTTEDPDLDALALKCIENGPQFHSFFSQTTRHRTYTFLYDDPFVYFGIFDEKLEKSQRMRFLSGVKAAFEGILERESVNRSDTMWLYRFQGGMGPVFRDLLPPPAPPSFPESVMNESRNTSLDSTQAEKMAEYPLFGKPGKGVKKKKRGMAGDINGEDNKVVDVPLDGGALSSDLSSWEKNNVVFAADGGRQRARQKWRQHLVVVLVADLVFCCVLFGTWLGICRGFKCIDG